MSEENLLAGVLPAQVRVDSLPAARQIVAVERQTDGTWRIAGSGASDESGLAELLIQAQYQSDIYALAIDEWGSKWAANMVVAVGDLVRPSSFVGWLYRVTQAGTLPVSEPDWWNSAALGPQPVGTATLEAVRYYRPLAHGPLAVDFTEIPWSPEYLLDAPKIILDAQSEVVDASGAASIWKDRSGNGYDFPAGSASSRPAILTGALNGLRVLRFDGVNDYLAHAGAGADLFRNTGAGWALTVTNKRTAATPSNAPFIFYSAPGPGSYNNRFGVVASRAGAPGYGGFVTRRLLNDAQVVLTRTESDIGNWVIRLDVADWAGGRAYMWANGVLDASDTSTLAAGTTSDVAGQGLMIGVAGFAASPLADSYSDIDVAAIVVGAGSIPSAAEIDKLIGWAAWEYGLVDSLPSSHPYKLARPTV